MIKRLFLGVLFCLLATSAYGAEIAGGNEYIDPDGEDNTSETWTQVGGSAGDSWTVIDDGAVPNDGEYLQEILNADNHWFSFSDTSSMPEGSETSKIEVIVRHKALNGIDTCEFKVYINAGEEVSDEGAQSGGTAFSEVTFTFTGTWTKSQVDAMKGKLLGGTMAGLDYVSNVRAKIYFVSGYIYTSQATGDFSDTDNWDEDGGPPGIGDRLIVSNGHTITVDENTTVGTDGAAGTEDATIEGALIIGAGCKLTMRGDMNLENATLTMGAGSTYEFDSSNAAGTPIYRINCGDGLSQTTTKITINGTSGSRCTVKKAAGSGNGQIRSYTANAAALSPIRATYCDFSDLGAAALGIDGDGLWLTAGDGQEIYFEDCTFTSCGRIYMDDCHGGADIHWVRNRFVSTIDSNAYGFWPAAVSPTTGERILEDNVWDGTIEIWTDNLNGFTVDGNVWDQFNTLNAMISVSPPSSFAHNLKYQRRAIIGNWCKVGLAGGTYTDNYVVSDLPSTGLDPGGLMIHDFTAHTGTITFDGTIGEVISDNSTGDMHPIYDAGAGNTITVAVEHCITLPNSAGEMSMSVASLHGGADTTLEVENNTFMAPVDSGDDSIGGIYTGALYPGHANILNVVRDNIVWSGSVSADDCGFVTWYSDTRRWCSTADSGTTTTITDADRTNCHGTNLAFTTAANETLGDGGCKVIITVDGSGSGPAVGESATISSNTGTVLTFGPALTAAPDNQTQYKTATVDYVNVANCDYNYKYNLESGTIYDDDGGSGASKTGYDGFWLTDQGIGAHDITATGSDPDSDGPQFIDSSRNMATFDTAYLGNSETGWDTYAADYAFVVDNFVSNSDANFYSSTTINFRCVTDHARNTANSEPGVGSAWRTYWEVASVERIKDAIIAGTTYGGKHPVQFLHDWVEIGFTPRSSALAGTGSSGDNIGATDIKTGTMKGGIMKGGSFP